MKVAVIVFPGSNCDRDCRHVAGTVFHEQASFDWHKDQFDEKAYDLIILPGGFSYGDYLRCGAIARFSPVMQSVIAHAKRGGFVLGICNGFQVLTEAHLLPGALIRNTNLKFVCKDSCLRVENAKTRFTSGYKKNAVISVPIAHGEGNYRADDALLSSLVENGQIVFTYCTEAGDVTPEANPNGSCRNIAGIINREGNVLGMMPHPERVSESILGGTGGAPLFQSIFAA